MHEHSQLSCLQTPQNADQRLPEVSSLPETSRPHTGKEVLRPTVIAASPGPGHTSGILLCDGKHWSRLDSRSWGVSRQERPAPWEGTLPGRAAQAGRAPLPTPDAGEKHAGRSLAQPPGEWRAALSELLRASCPSQGGPRGRRWATCKPQHGPQPCHPSARLMGHQASPWHLLRPSLCRTRAPTTGRAPGPGLQEPREHPGQGHAC